MTPRQELERFMVERDTPDGHYERVSLWAMVEEAMKAEMVSLGAWVGARRGKVTLREIEDEIARRVSKW